MPALQPADKAMTLDIDLATLQATPTSAAPPPPGMTDFSEPQNPYAQQDPAPSRTAVYPPVPPQISQYFGPSQPAAGGPPQAEASSAAAGSPMSAPAPPAGGPPSAAPAPPAGSAMPAPAPPAGGSKPAVPAPAASSAGPAAPKGTASQPQRQCFTNAEGVKICYMYDQQSHNTTDVHKEGGVNDYHNASGGSEKEGLQGHIPGNNITGTLDNLGQNPPPNEHKQGDTVFQGSADVQVAHQQDIHKDKVTYTDHELDSGNGDFDWKSAYKGPDGSKEMAEVDRDGQFRDEEDTRVDGQGKEKVGVEEWKGSDGHRFMSDKPGTKDDSQLVWDEDWQQKKQSQEFQGKGVYDLHEESSSQHQVQAKVDGDQGWEAFKQDMDEFDDAFFDEDAEWKMKMKDPRYRATSAAAVAGSKPTSAGAAGAGLRKRECSMYPQDCEAAPEKSAPPAPMGPDHCVEGETAWHCACRLGKARPYPCVAIYGVRHPALGQGPKAPASTSISVPQETVGALVRRSNPWKDAWGHWKQDKKNYDNAKNEPKEKGPDENLVLPAFPHGDEETMGSITGRDISDVAKPLPDGTNEYHGVRIDNLGIAVIVLLVILTLLTVGTFGWRKVQRRRQARRYQESMREVDGFDSIEVSPRDHS